ncbi:hypothetical protein K1719_020282 [Acacia pycnantha]|nr:hypothetical protein K1719_020282 [Acacia pycnantha]
MSQPGNAAGGETPPSSPSQTSPIQTHVTANNESHIINEPSQPLNNAGGRRAPLGVEEPRQPPLGANQESHIINEQVPPPHHSIAIARRRTPPSRPKRVGIGEPRETRLVFDFESDPFINDPALTYQEFLQPRRAADRIEAPRPQRSLALEQHRLRHYLTYQELPFINDPALTYQEFLQPRRAADRIEAPRPQRSLALEQHRLRHYLTYQELPFINDPALTYQEFLQPRRAADRIEAPRPQRSLALEQHRLRHYLTYQELPFINEPFLTPHRAADGRRTQPSPSSQRQIGIQDPGQPLSRVNNESLTINEQVSPPHHANAGRRTPPSLTLSLGIGEPHQTPRIANQECHTINPPFQTPHHHAVHGRITPPSPSSKRQLGIQESSQPPSRVNNESLTIRQPSPSLYFPDRLTELQALNDQYLLLSKKYKLQNQQHALRVNQESHTIKKPSRVNQESHTIKKPSSSSEGRRGGVVALRCATCKNTSTTQKRSDPTGQKWQSLCNACWDGLNRLEETRAASGLQSLNTLWPPPMLSTAILARALHVFRNRDEDIENNDNQFVPENNFLGPSSGLQSLNIVPPPPEMPPPAAPSLANRVQHVENISGLQSSTPLRDPPEEAVTTGNVIAAVTNFSAGRNKVDQFRKRSH